MPLAAIPVIRPYVPNLGTPVAQIEALAVNGIIGSNPLIVPDGVMWRIITVYASSQLSAVAGTRLAQLQVSTVAIAGLLYNVSSGQAAIASQRQRVLWGIGLGATTSNDGSGNLFATQSLPDFLLPPESELQISVNGGQLGDDWTKDGGMNAVIEQYPEGTYIAPDVQPHPAEAVLI